MFTYTYDLRALGYSEEEYQSIALKAQSLARGASAVDTGRFKRSWVTRVDGDILVVSNSVRYAPFVELGSAVYRFHRYRIKRALETLGLSRGKEQFGPGASKDFSTPVKPSPSKETREGQAPTTGLPKAPQIQPITEQEIRSPALLLRRLTIPRATQPVVPSINSIRIPKSQLFNRSRLLELIIAAEIVNENINEETQ